MTSPCRPPGTARIVRCDVTRDSVCMGDDVDARHEFSTEIDCTGVDDVALRCVDEIAGRAYLPNVVGGSTWVAEATGLPVAVVTRGADDGITVRRSTRDVPVTGDCVALFFSYHLRRDPEGLLGEIDAGAPRPER